jgi:hypothetical protein
MDLRGVGADSQAPISNVQVNTSGTLYHGWSTYIQNSILYFNIEIGDNGTGEVRLSVNISSYYNNMTMFTIVRKASTGTKIYANGTLIASNSSTVNPVYTTTHTPALGVWKTTYASPLSYYMKNGGKIDALDIQTKELSSTEVTELYNSALGTQYYPSVEASVLPNANDSLLINNGTAVGGLTYGVGKNGNAFTFNGTNSAVSLPTNMFNSFTGDFSIAGWVYIPSFYVGSDQINLICNFYAPGWAYNFKGFRLCTAGNSILWQLADGSSYNGNTGLYSLQYNYGPGFTTDSWYHIGVTRKAGVGSKIYMNGSLVLSDSNTVNPIYHTTMTPRIGNMYIPGVQDGYYAPANSMIDELMPYNRELSATEMADLYNSGTGKFYPTF